MLNGKQNPSSKDPNALCVAVTTEASTSVGALEERRGWGNVEQFF